MLFDKIIRSVSQPQGLPLPYKTDLGGTTCIVGATLVVARIRHKKSMSIIIAPTRFNLVHKDTVPFRVRGMICK